LRKLLPDGTITWSEGKLSLDTRLAWVDLWALERELGRLDQTPPADAAAQAALVDRVFHLYRGEFLAESTASWALKARERLRNKTLRLATRAAESLTLCSPAVAVPIYEKAIEIDPLRESLYQGLMRCHRELHQPAEGLRTYQRCRDTLQRELSLAPAPVTEALHNSLKSGS
jgi:two-component SAPR family response regulator